MKKIYIILFTLILFQCGNENSKTKTNTIITENSNQYIISKQQFDNESMLLGYVTQQPFSTIIKSSGLIDVPPENKSVVSSFIDGYITKIPLLVGDKVNKGQIVATIEHTEIVELQQNYLEISEQLGFLKNEYERQKTLYDEQITSQKNYLKAESNYKSYMATYNGLRKKLEMLHINPNQVEQGQISPSINLYAPISGYITKVNVSNGSYISPSSDLLEIVNTEHIHLELSVFEKDILNVKKDQSIKFKVPEASKTIYDAEVHLVGTSIDEKRTIKVHGHINNENNTNFIVGMFVEADIITAFNKLFAIPIEAVTKIDNNYFALVLEEKNSENYIFNKVKLDVGISNESFYEILNANILKDKEILVKGGFMIINE
jgi:cobalt-zinc-cadmium efflux system membrane fusion protein